MILNNLHSKTAIVLFAKSPVLGQVKTRLAKSIGQDLALKLHIAFISDFIDQVCELSSITDSYLYLTDAWNQTTTPLPKKVELEQTKIGYQTSGDLGSRLSKTFLELFSLGYQTVIITGTDSPNLPISYLEEAVLALKNSDCVLGPALDGGYYLIGLQSKIKTPTELFQDISWSTEKVFLQTLTKIKNSKLTFNCLPSWYDIDNLEDLLTLKQDLDKLAKYSKLCVNTRALLDKLTLLK